jgi:release factor glutamine methyltransferase
VPGPHLDARLLVGHALGASMETIVGYPDRTIDIERQSYLATLVDRRAKREPMAYILGHREFWSMPIRVTTDTLVPRPESETLVEAVLEWVGEPRAHVSILDLGTGSGCLLLALLSMLPDAWGVGVDVSIGALAVARSNAHFLGAERRCLFVNGDWGSSLGGRFDIVVANPPYIAEAEFTTLDPEVRQFEPRLALAGGADGLASYREVVPQLSRLLVPGGAAFLEVGAGSAAFVTEMIRDRGFQDVEIKNDLAGVARCVRVSAGGLNSRAKKKVGNQSVPV